MLWPARASVRASVCPYVCPCVCPCVYLCVCVCVCVCVCMCACVACIRGSACVRAFSVWICVWVYPCVCAPRVCVCGCACPCVCFVPAELGHITRMSQIDSHKALLSRFGSNHPQGGHFSNWRQHLTSLIHQSDSWLTNTANPQWWKRRFSQSRKVYDPIDHPYLIATKYGLIMDQQRLNAMNRTWTCVSCVFRVHPYVCLACVSVCVSVCRPEMDPNQLDVGKFCGER
jgi:hypothetical protein